ncbi:hypothetical protein ACFLSQ_01385 [Bacteroidota bacterium]
MPLRLIIISIIGIVSYISVYAENYYIPKTSVLGVTSGIYYDNTEDINRFLKKNNLPQLETANVYFAGCHYKSNYLPLFSNIAHKVLYSFDIRFPFTRKVDNPDYSVEMQTHSFFVELTAFESYIKTVTVHPILGFGLSSTNLIIERKNRAGISDGFLEKESGFYNFKKTTALFNIGGGCDLRINWLDNAIETKNILFSFEARYSIALDFTNIYNTNWTLSSSDENEIPDYYAPGLSIEIKIALETQKKNI